MPPSSLPISDSNRIPRSATPNEPSFHRDREAERRRSGQRNSAAFAIAVARLRDRSMGWRTETKPTSNDAVLSVPICQKGRRIGCVIPQCNLRRGITQPITQIFRHICSWWVTLGGREGSQFGRGLFNASILPHRYLR